MTERELRAVAEAIGETMFYTHGYATSAPMTGVAQAAISASDSKYVKGLVEALKEITKEENTIRPAVPAWGIAVRALRNLPEDLRK